MGPKQADYEKLAVDWHDDQKYGPTTRFRRKIVNKILDSINFNSILEVGCGQPYLIVPLANKRKFEYMGTDISKNLIEDNKKEFPRLSFQVLDVEKEKLNEQYDIVMCSEVLEHIKNYNQALVNISSMAKKYILITVPSSNIYPTDKSFGHLHHFEIDEITKPLEDKGFKIVSAFKWGFPFFNLYKELINKNPDKMLEKFHDQKYSTTQKIIAYCVFLSFFFNVKNHKGKQLVVFMERI